MTMRRIATQDAQTRFGELVVAAQDGPVAIDEGGEAVAVLLSSEAYREYESLKLAHLRGEIGRGMADLAAGRVVDGEAAFDEVGKRLDGEALPPLPSRR